MKKRFPATIDGLGAAIAYKRLHPQAKISLCGRKSYLLEKFPQIREVDIHEDEESSIDEKTSSCASLTSYFVLEMEKKKFHLKRDDALLFAHAIYLSTHALTTKNTSFWDLEALSFCFKHGGNLVDIKVRISPLGSFRTAFEIMTKPVKSVESELSVSQIADMIKRTGFTGFPVIDERKKVIGVVTKKDVERAMKAHVEDLQLVMSIPPIVVRKDATLEKVGQMMALHDIGRVIVIDNEMHPLGIITRRDLVRAVVSLNEEGELTFDISREMKKNVSPFLLSLLMEIGNFADKRGERVYAVGGFVRDLLMGRASLDVDIVVEGDGPEFAKEFAKEKGVGLKSHPEFKTATLFIDGISIDMATARTEYYENPGALPRVESSNLRKDLYRRDFTINAMAIALNPNDFGTLIDFFGGRKDLRDGVIRVLHSMSFVEDPTRILRALRYAARFKYRLQDKTEMLLKDALRHHYLKAVSEARIRAELEKSLKVDSPAEVFDLFQKYGIFEIFPCRREVDFYRYFEIVRKMEGEFNVFYSIILLLLKPCAKNMVEEIFKKYGIPKKFLEVFNRIYDSSFLTMLQKAQRTSSIFFLLEKIPKEALATLAYENENVREKIFLFLKIKDVKLEKVNGTLVKEYGFEGTEIGRIMKEILKLKLDEGMDELEALKKIIKGDIS